MLKSEIIRRWSLFAEIPATVRLDGPYGESCEGVRFFCVNSKQWRLFTASPSTGQLKMQYMMPITKREYKDAKTQNEVWVETINDGMCAKGKQNNVAPRFSMCSALHPMGSIAAQHLTKHCSRAQASDKVCIFADVANKWCFVSLQGCAPNVVQICNNMGRFDYKEAPLQKIVLSSDPPPYATPDNMNRQQFVRAVLEDFKLGQVQRVPFDKCNGFGSALTLMLPDGPLENAKNARQSVAYANVVNLFVRFMTAEQRSRILSTLKIFYMNNSFVHCAFTLHSCAQQDKALQEPVVMFFVPPSNSTLATIASEGLPLPDAPAECFIVFPTVFQAINTMKRTGQNTIVLCIARGYSSVPNGGGFYVMKEAITPVFGFEL